MSRMAQAAGHGKGVVDGVNGVTKSKITWTTARQLLEADEKADVKKLDPCTMRGGQFSSPALEVQRWLNLEGDQGAKSVAKSKKGKKTGG